MYSKDKLSEEDIKHLEEISRHLQTEESHGEGMNVNVSRESSNEVSTSVSDNGSSGLDLSFHKKLPEADKENPTFPSAEEASDYFMDEAESIKNEIAKLDSQAAERKNRIKQKQNLRELKKELRNAKVREAISKPAEKLEPLVYSGKKTSDFLSETGRRGAGVLDRIHERNEERGIALGFGNSELGLVGGGNLNLSLNKDRNGGKKESIFDFGGKGKDRLVDWGSSKNSGLSFVSDKKSGISFDRKPGSGFSLFGEDDKKKKKGKRKSKRKKKSKKKGNSLDINVIIKGGK